MIIYYKKGGNNKKKDEKQQLIMASTRNRNSEINYKQETKSYQHAIDNTLYLHNSYGEAYQVKTCGNGLNPGRIHSSHLSHNSTDIESFLRGIRSTDLTSSPFLQNPGITSYIHPSFMYLAENDLYAKESTTIVPISLTHEKDRRPLLR